MTEDVVPTVTTQHPTADPLVLTAPLNTPVSFDQLLANSAGGTNLQTQITTLQSQMVALTARVTALESAAGEVSSTASEEGGSHERHRDHTARPSSGHRHS